MLRLALPPQPLKAGLAQTVFGQRQNALVPRLGSNVKGVILLIRIIVPSKMN
jgi:hypothetical protein